MTENEQKIADMLLEQIEKAAGHGELSNAINCYKDFLDCVMCRLSIESQDAYNKSNA